MQMYSAHKGLDLLPLSLSFSPTFLELTDTNDQTKSHIHHLLIGFGQTPGKYCLQRENLLQLLS